jgi:hypothetical protein
MPTECLEDWYAIERSKVGEDVCTLTSWVGSTPWDTLEGWHLVHGLHLKGLHSPWIAPWKLQLDVPPILSKPIYLQVMNCFHPVKFCYGGGLVYIGTVWDPFCPCLREWYWPCVSNDQCLQVFSYFWGSTILLEMLGSGKPSSSSSSLFFLRF